jgi:DNA-binding NarL/FixJ family response regulator
VTDVPPRIRVLVVDDHEVVRAGIISVLSRAAGMDVCGDAASPEEALRLTQVAQPDVVIMDVRFAGVSGIEATREIRTTRPATQVIMFTSFADDDALFASIMAGAAGFILKQSRSDELVSAIHAVAAGHSLLDAQVTSTVLARLREGRELLKDAKLARLSRREEQILTLVAGGKTNREIATAVYLSEKTVKNHVTRILSKLEVARRAEAAAYFTRQMTLLEV